MPTLDRLLEILPFAYPIVGAVGIGIVLAAVSVANAGARERRRQHRERQARFLLGDRGPR